MLLNHVNTDVVFFHWLILILAIAFLLIRSRSFLLTFPISDLAGLNNKSKLSHRDITSEEKKCNCQKPSECPMSRNCLAKSVIYQTTVKTSDKRPTQTYVKASFINLKKRNSTELSKYIWDLKDNNINYSIT